MVFVEHSYSTINVDIPVDKLGLNYYNLVSPVKTNYLHKKCAIQLF